MLRFGTNIVRKQIMGMGDIMNLKQMCKYSMGIYLDGDKNGRLVVIRPYNLKVPRLIYCIPKITCLQ